MNREMFIAKLTEVQQTVEQLLSHLQASDMTPLRLISTDRGGNCERAGKSGKPIEMRQRELPSCREFGIQRRYPPMGTLAAGRRLRIQPVVRERTATTDSNATPEPPATVLPRQPLEDFLFSASRTTSSADRPLGSRNGYPGGRYHEPGRRFLR